MTEEESLTVERMMLRDKRNDEDVGMMEETNDENNITKSTPNDSFNNKTIIQNDPKIQLTKKQMVQTQQSTNAVNGSLLVTTTTQNRQANEQEGQICSSEMCRLKEISDSFEMECLDGLFERCDNEDEKGSSYGEIFVKIIKSPQINDTDNEITIEGPHIKIECAIKYLPKRKVNRDFEIGLIQLSERSIKRRIEEIEYYCEFFSYLVYDKNYVLDRMSCKDNKEYNDVHPYYSKESFYAIKKGSIPEEEIILFANDIPTSSFDGNTKWDQYEKSQRFPVYVVIRDGVELNFRILYSFEWMLHIFLDRNNPKCEKNVFGLIKECRKNKFVSMRTAFDYPVCNYGEISFFFNTTSKEVVVYYPKEMNGLSKEEFERKIKSKLKTIHPGIQDIHFE